MSPSVEQVLFNSSRLVCRFVSSEVFESIEMREKDFNLRGGGIRFLYDIFLHFHTTEGFFS